MKNSILYIVLIIIVGLMVGVNFMMPKEVNWLESYMHDSKDPYGCYLLKDRLVDLYHQDSIKIVRSTIYQKFNSKVDWSYNKNNAVKGFDDFNSNLVFINDFFNINELETETLLSYVNNGGNVIVATNGISEKLSEALGVKMNRIYTTTNDTATINNILPLVGSIKGIDFDNKQLSIGELECLYHIVPCVNNQIDNEEHIGLEKYQYTYTEDELLKDTFPKGVNVLGMTSDSLTHLIDIPYGEGHFIISSIPKLFTNYYMLNKNDYQYAEYVLNIHRKEKLYWDSYYKPGRVIDQDMTVFIKSQPSLNWAFHLLSYASLLFLFFAIKRRQRAIPIISPPVNSTISFVKTIAQLYKSNTSYSVMLSMHIKHLYDFITQKYHIDIDLESNYFYELMCYKSGLPKEELVSFFNKTKIYQNIQDINKIEFIGMYKEIEKFKNKLTGLN